MKVYEAIETCTISYREYDKVYVDGSCLANDFVLYPGDTIFIDSAGWMLRDNVISSYIEFDKLTKIYHNKLVDVVTGKHEWTWINDLDVINPKIDKIHNIKDNLNLNSRLKDVTLAWERNGKLEELGI